MAPPDVAFFAALLFLLGILAASSGWHIGTALTLVTVCFLAYKWTRYSFAPWRALPFVILLPFAFGFSYYLWHVNYTEIRQVITYRERISFAGVVREEVQPLANSQKLVLTLDAPFRGTITVIAPPFPEFSYGDAINVRGIIEPPERPRELGTAVFPQIELRARHEGFWLKEALLALKHAVMSQFRTSLPADHAALAGGLTLGVRSDFSRGFSDDMKLSGTTHLVALSGYNIAILVWFVAGAIGSFAGRRLTFVLTMLVIGLFVAMVGGEASVVRAAIMGFLLLVAREIDRPYYFRNAITLTAAIMALLDPTIVRFDLGFILSFISLLGIAYLAPALQEQLGWEKRETGIFGWHENVTTTIAAQLAVLPVLAATVGRVSLSGFFSNILILPLVPLTMAVGFLMGALGLITESFAFLLAPAASLLLSYHIAIIHAFARVPLLIQSFPNSLIFFLCYYGIILFFVVAHGRRTPHT